MLFRLISHRTFNSFRLKIAWGIWRGDCKELPISDFEEIGDERGKRTRNTPTFVITIGITRARPNYLH